MRRSFSASPVVTALAIVLGLWAQAHAAPETAGSEATVHTHPASIAKQRAARAPDRPLWRWMGKECAENV